MEYRQLGQSDLKVSAIGYGAWGIGGFPFWKTEGKSASIKSIEKAFDLGINFFDTAPVYGFGVSEEIIGKALKKVRNKIILATKCGLRWDKKNLGSIKKNAAKNSISQEIECSLRRLKTNWIDLYQVHWPDIETPQEETMEALHDVVKSGKARYIGASSMYAWELSKAQEVAKANGWTRFVSMQNHYNLIYREEEREMIPLCINDGLAITPWSPLARGFLAGNRTSKGKGKTDRSKNDVLADNYYYSDNDFKILKEVKEIAKKDNKSN